MAEPKKTDWLDNLKIQIIDARDKDNFDDLIKCYQNGLLRAGFVMAWLMLVESLKRKVVDLSAKGVRVAVEKETEIQAIEAAMKSNDSIIIDAALSCDLISTEEKSVLDLLWGKRCIMSHPYMPQVKESDFRYMVENLVSISLAKSIMWSQSMIDDFFSDIKTNLFMIPNTNEGRVEYANNVLALIPEKNRPFFWKTLFYEYSLSIGTGKRKQQSFLRLLASLFILNPDIDINDPKYTIEKQIKGFCAVCWRIFRVKSVWNKLNKDYQGQLFRFLEDNKEESRKVLDYAKEVVEQVEDLEDEYITCYYNSLKEYDVCDVERYYIDKNQFLDRLYAEKISGWQFIDHGHFVEMMKSMTDDEIKDYTPLQLQRLGSYMFLSCNMGTFKAQDFVKYNYETWIRYLDFVKGFVIENFTSEGNLKLNPQKVEYSATLFRHLSEEELLEIIESLASLPNERPCTDADECDFIRKSMGKIFEEGSKAREAFGEVIEKYCAA